MSRTDVRVWIATALMLCATWLALPMFGGFQSWRRHKDRCHLAILPLIAAHLVIGRKRAK